MMNDTGITPSLGNALELRSDPELDAMIAAAQEILARREQERRKQALEQIQDIAKAAGLSVNITKKPRRGRPPKKPQSGP